MALEDLARYESAAVAAMNAGKERQLAVLAMETQYRTILGKDFEGDPIYENAFNEALEGGEDNITNVGVLRAIKNYAGKYEKALVSTKFSDLVKYLTEGYKVSDEVEEALGKYSDLTIKDLDDKGKELSKEEKKEIAKAVQAISILKERRLRAKTLDIYNGVVKRQLEGLYPKKEEEAE